MLTPPHPLREQQLEDGMHRMGKLLLYLRTHSTDSTADTAEAQTIANGSHQEGAGMKERRSWVREPGD